MCPLQTDPNRCCVANFDGVGGVQVADIFAFMDAFFGLDQHANVNADGVVNVQDIFDFLGAWWVGCP